MSLKRILCGAMAFTMAASLTACGGKEESSTTSAASDEAVIKTEVSQPVEKAEEPEVEKKPEKEVKEESKSKYYFEDGVLQSEDVRIEITDYEVITMDEVTDEYSWQENPEIVFYYDVTNLSGNKDVTAATAWMAMFTVIQDNDPNVVNTLESGWYSDPDITVDGFATMKKDGTVSYYASYELDDLTTPVTLEATRGIGGEELGTQTFEIEGK